MPNGILFYFKLSTDNLLLPESSKYSGNNSWDIAPLTSRITSLQFYLLILVVP